MSRKKNIDNEKDIDPKENENTPDLSRRGFINKGCAVVGGVAALAGALSPLSKIDSDDLPSANELLQKHYKEMSKEEMAEALERIRKEVEKRYALKGVQVTDDKSLAGVEYVYGLNLSRCIGCRRCVHACVKENNQSRSPEIQYIRVVEMPMGTTNLEQGDHHYDPESVPRDGHYYMPIQCHQCADAPCVKACPIEATWQDEDGIVVIDYDWCIGCRYCEAACPYWARRFNFTQPEIASDQINPDMTFLSNRPRKKGVMEKCHFCLQRTRRGKMPACLEVCPTGSRKFGNVLDPDSEVSAILKTKRIFVLKEDLGTLPRFFYYYDERHPRNKIQEGEA